MTIGYKYGVEECWEYDCSIYGYRDNENIGYDCQLDKFKEENCGKDDYREEDRITIDYFNT